jgi:hypothetical protein
VNHYSSGWVQPEWKPPPEFYEFAKTLPPDVNAYGAWERKLAAEQAATMAKTMAQREVDDRERQEREFDARQRERARKSIEEGLLALSNEQLRISIEHKLNDDVYQQCAKAELARRQAAGA